MDTMADAADSVRSRRQDRSDPAQLWSPLAKLADAAVNTATGSRTVAITRSFDRKSRQRARALRTMLNERDVGAIEVTPASGSQRLLAGTEIDAVISLLGTWQSYRLAATLQVPLLVPNAEDEASADVNSDVIGMIDATGSRDVALSRVTVRPEDSRSGSLTLAHDDQPLTLPGGSATIRISERNLEIKACGGDTAERTLKALRIRLAAHAPYRLIRDELPIAEFAGELTLTAEPGGLRVYRV